jgi:type IV pilus assembly protein PilQ
MAFPCRLLTVLVIAGLYTVVRADVAAPIVTFVNVTGERDRAEIAIEGSFVVPVYSISSSRDGKKVFVSIEGASLAKNGVQVRGSSALIGRVTASTTARDVNVEIALTRDAVYRARGASGKIHLLFEVPALQERSSSASSSAGARVDAPVVVTEVMLERRNGRERVLIETDRPAVFRTVPGNEGPSRLVISGARARNGLKSVIEGDSRSVVRTVHVRQDGDRVVIEASHARSSSTNAIREGDRIVWLFSPESEPSPAQPRGITLMREQSVEIDGEQVAAFLSDIPMQVRSNRTPVSYSGRRIDLDFKDADIQNILRLLSEVGNVNVVTSDEVKGSVTIRMRNVPWDQALEVILRAKGLGQVRTDNLIRVAPLATLEKERDMAIQRRKQQVQLAPLETRLIPSSYAKASDLSPRVKEMLSERGTVSVDERTNILVVRDVNENLDSVEELVRSLDSQTPQVLIEARVIEASSNFKRDVGIQWGGDATATAATGNPTGLAFPYDVTVAGGATSNDTNSAGISPFVNKVPNPNFAVDLPATVGIGTGGALGLTFGSVSGNFNLNVRLSAAETNGVIRIISSPRILTLDNHEADISQGTLIPYAQISAQGIQTAFKEAKLQLKVTPHVTSDGAISMQVNITRDEPDFTRTGARGDPTILKREANTNLLVQDSHTAVIGGIYTRNTSHNLNQVPFFGDLPILGILFKERKENDDRTELLIFLTPRIVNREEALRR